MKKSYSQNLVIISSSLGKINFAILALFFVLLGNNSIFGQTTCATALPITVNGSCITGATVDDPTQDTPLLSTCATGTFVYERWYKFTVTAGPQDIRIIGVSGNRNLFLQLISESGGSCLGLTQLDCANATTSTNAGQTETIFAAGLANGTYYIKVANVGNNNTMSLTSLCVLSPPSNDACAGALTLTSSTVCSGTTGSTTGATDNNEVGDCITGTENSVWYQFQAVTTTHVVSVSGITGFDPILNVISACGSATAPSGASCVNATGDAGTETLTLTGLTVGNYYKIQVHDSQGDLTANGFSICVTHTVVPTITSLGASSGCVGSSLIITGTDLAGATAVTIGGTAAAITASSSTTVTVTVGSGTTGTVTITTPGGSATSAATFTVNPLPTNPANPTSNSPQCNPPGVTITRAAAPPGTENYYWQTTSLGTSTANNANTYTATASGTYYIRAQTIATGCWSSGQGTLAVVIDPAISSLATTPSPATAATGACYSGTGAISSVSWTAASGATSYDVYFGAGSLPGSITSNVATTSYSTGTLLASTTYYWKIVPKNVCGITSGTPVTWTFTTAAATCACTPTGNLDCTLDDYISNVTFNSLNNTTTCGSGGYTVYPAVGTQTTTLVIGQAYTFNLSAGSGFGTHGAAVWIDFNQNGVFTDAGEYFLISNAIAASGSASISITIPAGATVGAVKMRVRYAYNVTVTSAMSCTMAGTWGETEDYTLTLVAAAPCTTPTAQPTTLALSSVTSTSLNGSFTAASPAPSGYLVVRSSSATPPTLTSGTTYAVGFTGLAPGTTYVVQGSAVTTSSTTFSDTGLTSNTRYYYHIFSYNSACTGAPAYFTTSPLTNNTVTCAAVPTSPVNSAITGTSGTISWTASVAGGGIGAINYTLEVYTNAGYTSPISGSPFSLGTGLTNSLSGLTSGTTYYYRIKANNGTCDSPYVTGTLSTTISNNQCSTATSLPCGTSNLAGTTVGAASFAHGSGCTMSNYGVWYSFVGDGNQNVISVTTTGYDIEMSIASGSCGSLTNIACKDVALSSGTETHTLNTVNGTTYYVYIAHWDSTSSTTGSFTISRTCLAPLTNDECTGAISLTPTTTCNYATYSNAGATASAGVTAPGCASYSGGDVWFSAVVPATGQLDIDLQTGSVTDSGIAFYSGSCGALSLLDCDDDSSSNGLMSFLSRTGLTPGQTIYIRVWEYGNDNPGTFGICATTPGCPSPSDLLANILSTTSVTVNWNASAPPASGGYQYYISTTNTPPTNATPPTGSTPAGVIGVTLTGLTAGQKYYFWVRSYCGGSDTSTWFGPTNYTPCNVGTGTGTTSLTCPSVLTGGLGLNGADPVAMSCQALGCVNLEATYLQLNQPTNYSVSSITYSPPYQFACLQNPVSVNVDDIWSPTINLPFNFCFYGTNYNKCLIGSNGVITFDTTTYTPGGYNAWSFANNLPNTSLFRNTIFGVYHDIDPSKGGEVGYELITLNTGCRALVASWNDIPMYSSTCNSILYSGMIVLYENTNVIEVYVKEKNVCSTWNDGNAIVGIQNAAGNAAVVAPNRNGLDANWTSNGEAWRFTPTGTSLTSIKWFEGIGTTGTQLGTTNTINVCPTASTVYTAEVTYALCSGTNLKYTDNVLVTVDGTKIWNGSAGTAWNTDANWTPTGVPTNANCIIIPDVTNDPIVSAAPDAVGYNLSVYNGAQLTVNSSQNITITDKVTVQSTGIFTLNNSASLIQINSILNSGNITYKRTSPSIRTLDYVYWSSPVSNFNISNLVAPYTFGPIYTWNTTIANSNGGQGTWQNFAGTMVAGKGYIARAPGTSPFNNSTYNPLNATFTGVPNNGNITVPIERGTDQNTATHYGTNGVEITNLSDNWNLLGNPYPSAIRASQFLFDNNTKILGNVRLWTHGQLPTNVVASPFYGSFISNYSAGDYMTYNFTGTSCCPAAGSDLFIGAGQGFFVQMIDGPAVAAAANITVGFNNNLRSATYSNSLFYRTQNSTISSSNVNPANIERNRIWLDLVNPNNQTDRTLFGYIENATMGKDSFYDCITQNTGTTLIYSVVDDTKFSIQGRALPFNVTDEVPIGINAPTQGNYTIAIAAVDGIFRSQNIYLKDDLLNITHDLRVTPYQFSTTQTGGINDRFKVVYVDNALEIPTHASGENDIRVFTNEEVSVSSSNLQMESIVVYNLLGQKLDTYENINANFTILSNLHKNNTTLLLKIKLQTGEIVTKQILY